MTTPRPVDPPIRPAGRDDEPFMRTMLAVAADWRPGTETRSGDEAMRDPSIAHYLADWPADGDLGVLAEDATGTPVGAAWLRRLGRERPGYGYVDDDTPELSIGVAEPWRTRGIGRRLLRALVATARTNGIVRISLSVEADNPAIDLYRSEGFVVVGGTAESPTMLLEIR